jgi:hypothetical protein
MVRCCQGCNSRSVSRPFASVLRIIVIPDTAESAPDSGHRGRRLDTGVAPSGNAQGPEHLIRRVIQPHRLPAHMPGGLAERCSLLCTGKQC